MAKKRVILVRHSDEPADDRVFSYLSRSGYEPVLRKPFAGELLENDRSIAGAVIFGGKYNVFDTQLHPFLMHEYRFIEHCITADIPLLGICQGAQQIAWQARRTSRTDTGRLARIRLLPAISVPGRRRLFASADPRHAGALPWLRLASRRKASGIERPV